MVPLTVLKGLICEKKGENQLLEPKFGIPVLRNFTEVCNKVHNASETCLGCPKTLCETFTIMKPTLKYFEK